MSLVRVYEVTKEHKFLSIARAIFSWVWREGWDTAVCGGGVWFDNTRGGKQTIEQVQLSSWAAGQMSSPQSRCSWCSWGTVLPGSPGTVSTASGRGGCGPGCGGRGSSTCPPTR